MPTVLMMLGWRFYFYANERDEPAHVHCKKGDAEAKYWLDLDTFEVVEAHAYNLSPADRRTVRRIILEHFDYLVGQWNEFQEERNG
jgi:hypothetical protein